MTEIYKTGLSKSIRHLLTIFICVSGASGIGLLFRYLHFPETNIVVVYILSVVLTARFTTGYVYGIAATVIATCAFNYFFTAPHFTLAVNDPNYFITFTIMSLTSIITSTLTTKVKQNALEAQEKEAATSALYQLTNHLTDASDISQIVGITVKTVSSIMHCGAACICYDENSLPEQRFIQQKNPEEQIYRTLKNCDEFKIYIENMQASFAVGSEFYDWPICARNTILGVLRIPKDTAQAMSETQLRLLRSMIESSALAMDRFRSAQERIKSRDEIAQERYRSNLLRAISHDLRTPLSGIMGTSEMLMDMLPQADERYVLAEGIYKDANWLHSLVENILSLTRLQDGKLILNKQMEALEEVVSVAVMVIAKRAPEYEITVHIPNDVLLIPMEVRLISQLLVNLLDNAVKHTLPEDEICLTVTNDTEKHLAVFSVADRGTGITSTDLPHIFQMFYTTHLKEPDAQRGVGLGLAICESIVTAHGGAISACNRIDGEGAEFIFTLPMEMNDHAN